MRSSFGGLSIGISGLFAQQRSLDVTGHNISNVNTPGYSRQSVNHGSSGYATVGFSGNGMIMQSGSGVGVQEIRQSSDEFLENKLRRENKDLGYWETRQASIGELETIFNDNTENGIQTVMDNFWNSWEQLSKPTGKLTSRALVKENAIAVLETIKTTNRLLNSYKANKDNEIKESVDRINDIAKMIANLNMEIKKTEAHGVVANDYRDERNKLVLELSGLAKINVYDGMTFNIGLEGRLIVDDTSYEEMYTKPVASNDGYSEIYWKRNSDPLTVSGGSLKSLFDSRDELVEGYRGRLNEFVKGLAAEINVVHITGYGIKDSIQRNMFINDRDGSGNNISIANIAFNPELNDFDNIAAAEEPMNIEDNRLALKIARVRQENIFSEDKYETDPTKRKYNFDECYRNLIVDIGNKGKEAITASTAQKILIDQISFKKQSITAVSIDEEMSNLIRFEHSYNAAARIVNAMDEMLDAIVNRIGVGGR